MSSDERREEILAELHRHNGAISASVLATQFSVSRQIIVGDIALLRARGHDIIATPRGYLVRREQNPGRYFGKVACQHHSDQTEVELTIIVEGGGEVLDVIVSHELYGEITGQLGIGSQQDISDFLARLRGRKARLLSDLTDGVHLHTIACRDGETFRRIRDALQEADLLYAGGEPSANVK